MAEYGKNIDTSGLKVVGPTLVIKQLEAEDKTGNIILPDRAKTDAEYLTNVGMVVAMGAEAYEEVRKDEQRFVRPWCSIGDYVVWSKYVNAGRINYRGETYVILNDDQICMVVDDPNDIQGDHYKITYRLFDREQN